MNRASGLDSESSSEDDDDMDSVFCLTLLGYLNGCGQVERQRGGSRPGKAPNKDRRRLYPKLLFEDYWGEAPVYDGKHFRRTFRMPRELFDKIHAKVARHDTYFKQKRNAAKLLGFTSLQQVVAAVRMLTSGASAHVLDDKFRLTESTAIENLLRFCSAIISIYEPQVLRSPNVSELERLLQDEIADGFPGCIGLK
ncbi:hypothetical protein AC1031_021931 [Aphanomyces cochlioides]|nr:hypothetical protein AC1031_021931 [Aphanomyces cochlioides]